MKFLLIGLIFIAVGLYLFIKTLGLLKNGVRTTAKVISHKLETDHDGGAYTHEVFEFIDTKGKLQHTKSLFGSSFGLYAKGERVNIVYDKLNPSLAIPDKRVLLYLFVFPIISGALLLVLHFTTN